MNRVEVKRISYYPPSKGFTVLLKEKNGDRQLQILVKSHKAQAIARYFEGAKMYRPMIHDVVVDIVEKLDAGPVMHQDKIKINENIDSLTLSKVLSNLGAKSIVKALTKIKNGGDSELINFTPSGKKLSRQSLTL